MCSGKKLKNNDTLCPIALHCTSLQNMFVQLGEKLPQTFNSSRDIPDKLQTQGRDERIQEDYFTFKRTVDVG